MLSAHRSKRASLTGNWDDLKAVKACAVCSAKFGVTRHKYHCRVCGHVICSACSRTRVHLPTSRSGQAKRVCDTCVPGVRAGLKAGETIKRVEAGDDAERDSEEERKLSAAAMASGGLLRGSSSAGDAAATAAAVAAVAAQGNVELLTADDEAEIVNDSLAEAGF